MRSIRASDVDCSFDDFLAQQKGVVPCEQKGCIAAEVLPSHKIGWLFSAIDKQIVFEYTKEVIKV